MTVETVKVLLLIAMFGALQAAMYLSELRAARSGRFPHIQHGARRRRVNGASVSQFTNEPPPRRELSSLRRASA